MCIYTRKNRNQRNTLTFRRATRVDLSMAQLAAHHHLRCALCQSRGKLLMCSKCCLVSYCSKECQKQHWKEGHKTHCKNNISSVKVVLMPQSSAEVNAADSNVLAESYEASTVPENIFNVSTPEQFARDTLHYTARTKSTRKGRGVTNNFKTCWDAAAGFAGCVCMHMRAKSHVQARKSLDDFFRLLTIFNTFETTEAERNVRQVPSIVASMEKNKTMLDLLLLKYQNDTLTARIACMENGVERTQQIYALLESIALEQTHATELGDEFYKENMQMTICDAVAGVILLMNVNMNGGHGEDRTRSFTMCNQQLEYARNLLGKKYACKTLQAKNGPEIHLLQVMVSAKMHPSTGAAC